MRAYGFDADTIAEALHKVNAEHCEPPKDDRNIEKMARSVEKNYKPDPTLSGWIKLEHYTRMRSQL